MGKRNRERIEQIRSGLSSPFRNLGEKMLASVLVPNVKESDIKVEKVIKTKCPSITNITEIKTCRQIMGILGNPKMPQRIIKEKTIQGMYKVVAKLKKFGETSDSIFEFYWNIDDFRELWDKIGCSKEDWSKIAKS